MIGFIGTSLQLQSIITAHTLKSFWTTSVWQSLWRIFEEFLTALNSRMNSFLKLPRGPNISHHVEQLIFLCYSVCWHGNLVFSSLLPSNDSFFAIHYSGNVISEPLLSNGRPLWFNYSGFWAVFTEPLPSNGLFSYNSNTDNGKNIWGIIHQPLKSWFKKSLPYSDKDYWYVEMLGHSGDFNLLQF
jgi:hypothetical protein